MPDYSWDDLLKEASKSEYQPLPEGVYDFVVAKSEATKSQAGKTMYKITAEVENNAEFNKRKVFSNLVVSPDSSGALMYFFKKMNAMGLNRDYFAAGPAEDKVAADLVGRRFRGKVKIEEYNGKDKNEIDEFLPAGAAVGGAAPPPPPPAPPAAAAPPPPPTAPVDVPAAPVADAGTAPPPPPF